MAAARVMAEYGGFVVEERQEQGNRNAFVILRIFRLQPWLLGLRELPELLHAPPPLETDEVTGPRRLCPVRGRLQLLDRLGQPPGWVIAYLPVSLVHLGSFFFRRTLDGPSRNCSESAHTGANTASGCDMWKNTNYPPLSEKW